MFKLQINVQVPLDGSYYSALLNVRPLNDPPHANIVPFVNRDAAGIYRSKLKLLVNVYVSFNGLYNSALLN
jgi:hypothetical protein